MDYRNRRCKQMVRETSWLVRIGILCLLVSGGIFHFIFEYIFNFKLEILFLFENITYSLIINLELRHFNKPL